MSKTHTFHIPVMGIGFTIDSPIKVSHLGIDSVVSLVDDILIEKMRKLYSEKYEIPYREISNKMDDFRAKRIRSYLNMVNEITDRKYREFLEMARERKADFKEFLAALPDSSDLKKELDTFTGKHFNREEIEKKIRKVLSKGSIDVNIMTKLDRENFKNGEKLDTVYNDAHAALRGFAESDLDSTLVLSAGMNPRLYAYIENFDDFYPDENGYIKKRIALKVSDYRSAVIQGKFLAKKGLWVTEFRIESGLNCGGHAFATEGYLMGPILEEFRQNRQQLNDEIFSVLKPALEAKNRPVPENLPIRVSAQGGVGTAEEHEFLLDYYKVDSVGWGTPFLLVPEATTVDDDTLRKLEEAKEKDLYLSDISPLGVPFNNLRGNSKDLEKLAKIVTGKPGSSCPKQYVALNKDYTEESICTASRQYQRKKIKELDQKALPVEEYQRELEKITVKSCICVGLGTSALLVNNLDTKVEGEGVSVCPGPNMAYFSKSMQLKDMMRHIYGKVNLARNDRPNMFLKELNLYLDYLKDKIETSKDDMNKKQEKYLKNFTRNLNEGIRYYEQLFQNARDRFNTSKDQYLNELQQYREVLEQLTERVESLKMQPVKVS